MRLIPVLLISMILTACGQQAGQPIPPQIDSLVSAEWLARHLGEPDLVILDATVLVEEAEDGSIGTVSGRAHYENQHIPGAAFADLKGELADAESPFGYAVPAPEVFAAAMEKLGVGDNTRVVIYDANGSSWAARVWWMLRWIGFDNAALLDGGLDAWVDAGQAAASGTENVTPGTLTVKLRPELIVDQGAVHAAIGDDDINIIDALPEAHYKGEFSLYERPGHIPGASNVSVRSLVEESGMYKSTEALQSLFDGDLEGRAITYCGGGIAASSTAFIMTRLGYRNVAVYTNSLQEWTADPANPLETD